MNRPLTALVALGATVVLLALLIVQLHRHIAPPETFPTAARPSCIARGPLPDATCTPGAANPAVTQENILETICVPGFTAKIRPPVSYTNALKRKQMIAYGIASASPQDVEEDHSIALTIGGDPRDPRNLWPQPRGGEWNAQKKDVLEVRLNRLVCAGDLPLADAQHAIATDWVSAYRMYVAP